MSTAWIILLALIGQALGEGTSGNASSRSKNTTAGGAYGASAAAAVNFDNQFFANLTLIILASIVLTITAYRVILHSVRYIRMLTCLNNDTQRYFRIPNLAFGNLKEHLLYAPLFRRRHNQEMYIVSGWSLGVLPTRFQTLLLLGIITMNVAFCTVGIEWSKGGSAEMLNHLRNRTGTLSVINMIPLVIMAGRNNPLIGMLNVSFDSFNVMHRMFGRIVAAEALVHTIAWMTNAVHNYGWKAVQKAFASSTMMLTGLIGTAAMVFIIFQASSVFRRAFYETFLHIHIALVILAIAGIWLHLEGTAQLFYIQIVVGAWAVERFVRVTSLIYRNLGKGGTNAIVEALPGDALRVTIRMARPWTFRPGQHMFLTMPSVGLWTSHPFSVAWSNEEEHLDSSEKGGLAMNRQDILAMQKTSMSLIIRRRDGFTDALYKKAENSPEGRIVVNALAEGPYGGLHTLHSYGTVMMFAGGVGITHQVPYVRDLVTGFANGTVATRRVILIWVIQSPEHLEWIRPWMTTILALDRRRDILRIQLFVTRPRSTKEIHSPSATVQMFPGRPNVNTLIGLESENQIGAMGVSVCGPGGLSDEVRRAVRKRQGIRNVDFVEESFSW